MKPVTKSVILIDHEATGRLVRELRVQTGLTILELAGRTGISKSQLSALELGRRFWSDALFDKVVSGIIPEKLGTFRSVGED